MISIQTKSGAGVTHDERVLIPIATSIRIRLPGQGAGLVWNRPLGVVARGEGEERLVRVWDLTRRLQLLVLCAGFAATFLLRLAARRGSRRGWRAFRR